MSLNTKNKYKLKTLVFFEKIKCFFENISRLFRSIIPTMSETTFDTLQYAKRLRDVGVPEQQAEVQAEALREIIENNLATKKDLFEVKTELKRDIAEMGLKMTIRFGGMLIVAVLVLAAIIKL